MRRRIVPVLAAVALVAMPLGQAMAGEVPASASGTGMTAAAMSDAGMGMSSYDMMKKRVTAEQRLTAVANLRAKIAKAAKLRASLTTKQAPPALRPGGQPDPWGDPNYAYSPLPHITWKVASATAPTPYNIGDNTILPVYDPSTGVMTDPVSGNPVTLADSPYLAFSGTGPIPPGGVTIDPINSIPQLDPAKVSIAGGIRKFVEPLPGFIDPNPDTTVQNCADPANTATCTAAYLPVANPDTTTYPGSDYYVIGLKDYYQQFSPDLPATKLRGYFQINGGVNHDTAQPPFYLGPVILSNRNVPVRIKFVNELATGSGGDLFIPVDTTDMGAGTGPNGGNAQYSQNRATLHLHGGVTPWISDGTPHQWTTPAGETQDCAQPGDPNYDPTAAACDATAPTQYPEGVSVSNVPDMDNGKEPQGTLTFFYTNQQSARLMFYHDHAYGITRLNVYAGEAAGYLNQDPVEQEMIQGTAAWLAADPKHTSAFATPVPAGTIPADQVPLVIQDKTFVPDTTSSGYFPGAGGQLAAEDPTWDTTKFPGLGGLWFPHVYMPNQNPYDNSGAAPMGRWDYGPWFWPVFGTAAGLQHDVKPNPYVDPANPLYDSTKAAWEPPVIPGTPNPSLVPEGFMDTPVVNGLAYPYLNVAPKAYRLRILNAANDRMWNLQMYCAKSSASMWNADGTLADANAGEVPMVPAVKTAGFPSTWPTDGRDGGVPDPTASAGNFLQIGTEGGFLPNAVRVPNQPVGYNYNRRDIVVLNVQEKALFLGPAERADVVFDFSKVPSGCTNVILYNDAPAPVPAFDPRNDTYTNDPDNTAMGGAPSTLPGYGPDTRTVMQFRINQPAPVTSNYAGDANLSTVLPLAFAASQDKPIVPETAYKAAYPGDVISATDNYSRIQDTSLTVPTTATTSGTVTTPMQPKAIQELFEMDYGRMNATLGVELPFTNSQNQTTLPMGYAEPTTEVLSPSQLAGASQLGSLNDGTQIWKITHNGVDTHAIHFHLFNVQVINRVGWDGAIRPPDDNELGWKETVRMNPLEDAIVAIRPVTPELPFKIPDSIRPIDPTKPTSAQIASFDPTTGQAITVPNTPQDFGWEYVWHCHLLGHEENDMMRPMVYTAAPTAPSIGTASGGLVNSKAQITVTWTAPTVANDWKRTDFVVQRATDAGFTTNVAQSFGGKPFAPVVPTFGTTPIAASATSFTDTTMNDGVRYWYRVRAESADGYSAWSAAVSATTPLAPPSGLAATQPLGTPISVTLAWTNNSTSATSLILQRANNSQFTSQLVSTPIGNPSTASYSDTTVSAGRTYFYRVVAVFGTAQATSNVASIAVTNGLPAAPTGLTASQALTLGIQVNLAWTYNQNYGVPVTFTVTRNGTQVATGVTGTAWTDPSTTLANNTQYTYTVAAVANGASSNPPASTAITVHTYAVPGTVTGVTAARTNTAGGVTVSWSPLTAYPAVTGYTVEYSATTPIPQGSASVSATGTSTTVTGLTSGTRYYFHVKANNFFGSSATWSTTVSATPR